MADADRLAICHPEFLEDLQHWVEQDKAVDAADERCDA